MDSNFNDWDLYAVVRGYSAPPPSQPPLPPPPPLANPAPSYSNIFDVLDYQNNPIPFEDLHEAYFLDPPPPPGATYAFQPPQEIMPTINPPSPQNLQVANPPPGRQRRRKNQQRIVYHLTQEELSTDSWAWKKYGQKAIKGCLYPRSNYYRCVTSKGCSTRRKVERSSNDHGFFVVSYTGEHTHPQPTQQHRSSLNRAKTSNKHLASTSSASFPQGTQLEVIENDDNKEDESFFMIENHDERDHDMFKRFHDSDHDHSSGGRGIYAIHGDGH